VRENVVVLVRLPEVPVIEMENVPVAAVLLGAMVSVLLPVVLVGLKVAVTPLGTPEADNATVPLKPFCGVTETVVPALPVCAMLKLFGAADKVKPGGTNALTVSETVAVLVNVPDVPVTVIVAVPVLAVLLAVRVSVLVLVALLGLNEAVTPVGMPVAAKLTLLLKPFSGFTVIVLLPLAP
jgi:hypothetical protein